MARLNSPSERQQAVADVEHLTFIRSEIVRQIQRRRDPLIEDRDRAREMIDVLEGIHPAEPTVEREKEFHPITRALKTKETVAYQSKPRWKEIDLIVIPTD